MIKEYTQDHFLNTIVEGLIHNLAYYLPKELIPEIVLIDLKGKISPQFFNKLAILDIYQGIGEFEVIEFSDRLAKKRKRFEKTIFELLTKRKELEAAEFDYLIDKYFRQVEFYLAIANWLRLNTANYKSINKQIDLSTKGYFDLQYEVYELHFTELINSFYKGKELNLKESFTKEELLKNYFQDLITRLQLVEEELIIDQSIKKNQNELLEANSVNQKLTVIAQTATTVNKQQNPTKKKKRPMVTEQEAYDFLLTSVFNVDPEIILK